MSWSIVLVLGAFAFSAHSALHRTKDATLSRIARSPHYGSHYHQDDFVPPTHGPPPPPIVYHTQNWSGVAKGLGGAPQGVFSGAAASAQSTAPAASEAFSIAASGTGPLTSDDEGQVKDNLGKSGFSSQSNYGGSESHYGTGSLGNKYGGRSNGYDGSSEEQYNIKPSGLEFEIGASGSGSTESKSQSGQYSAGALGFNRKSGSLPGGYGSSSGQYKLTDYDRQSGQRSINSGFDEQSFGSNIAEYGKQNDQHGFSKAFSETGSGGKFSSGSSPSDNSAGSTAGFGSQSGQSNFQTSNKGLTGFNGQSGQYGAASSGYGSKSTDIRSAGSANHFGQYNGQSSGSGHHSGEPNREYESSDNRYETRREFESHGGYGSIHSNNHENINRQGKNHHETNQRPQNGGGKFDYQSAGQGQNGQIHNSGFINSPRSSFESNRGNYGSGSSGSAAGYTENQGQGQGQVKQFSQLNTGFSASPTGSQDFSGTQHVKRLGQLDTGFNANQAESQDSGAQSQSSSGAGFGYNKKYRSSNIESKDSLLAGNAGEVSPVDGSLSAGLGASGQEDVQSTLGSALNLASQGLQTAQRTPCSTCDKSSYALSNAKSHSGSAIALSIGG